MKFNKKMIESMANDMIASKIVDISNSTEFKDLVLTTRIGSVEYNVWNSKKEEGKYEVIKLVDPSSKTAEKDSHETMAKEDILKNIVLKAFYKDKELEKIVEKLCK